MEPSRDEGVVFVALVSEFEPGKARVVRCGRTDVAVFRDRGEFYAFKDACPHQGHPLHGGSVQEGVLSCPGHNWRFELATGRCIKGEPDITLKRYEVLVREGGVYLQENR